MAPVGLMRELRRSAKSAGDDKLTGEQPTVLPSAIRRTSLVANDDGGSDVVAASPTLTKAELATALFENVGFNMREAKDLVDTFFDEVNSALERGESVKLTGFGNFQLRDKVSRPGRNPKTGVEVQIPARRVVTFHASQKLKEMVDTSPLARQADETRGG